MWRWATSVLMWSFMFPWVRRYVNLVASITVEVALDWKWKDEPIHSTTGAHPRSLSLQE